MSSDRGTEPNSFVFQVLGHGWAIFRSLGPKEQKVGMSLIPDSNLGLFRRVDGALVCSVVLLIGHYRAW